MGSQAKVAIVTGAGTGIGKAVALALLKEGYSVALAGRRAELLDKAIAESAAGAARTLAVTTDVGNPESVRALFAKTREKFGRLAAGRMVAGNQAAPANAAIALARPATTRAISG
jgi:NAD(P)-dependent dehydrogenase (short-subunit alcohol dehydrogenase family)